MNFIKKTIFTFYTFFSTVYENIFYKKNTNNNSNLLVRGYEKLYFSDYINFKRYFTKKINGPNQYLNKLIIEKDKVKDLLLEVFVKNKLYKKIYETTGFNYSIDFFVAYETLHIPENLQEKQIYANHWHKDKPFSKNTLKIIIPLEEIDEDHGGIEILDKLSSKIKNHKINEYEFQKNLKFYKMIAKTNEYLLFLPNLCFHRAGNPLQNFSRKQLMFQLNPSKNWCFKKNLFYLQFLQEPKFPLFKSFGKKDLFIK